MKEAPSQSRQDFITTYITNKKTRKWSLWFSISFGLYVQVDSYIHNLWIEIDGTGRKNTTFKAFTVPKNIGAVYAVQALLSVVFGLILGSTRSSNNSNSRSSARAHGCLFFDWVTWGSTIFGVGSLIQGVSLIVLSQTSDLNTAYGAWVVFRSTFQVLIIISK
jgi:hypothetical protein